MVVGVEAADASSKPAWRHTIRRLGQRGSLWASEAAAEVDHSSERRPWDRRPLATRPGHSAPSEQQVGTTYQCCYFPLSEQRAELVGRLIASLTNCCQLPPVELTACPSPQQSPEFVIGVEADAMINSEYPAGAAKDVAALAIGIVDQYVEDGQQSQIGYVGVDHRHRTIFAIEAFYRGKPALHGQRRTRNKINKLVGGRLVDLHPDLKRSRVRMAHR